MALAAHRQRGRNDGISIEQWVAETGDCKRKLQRWAVRAESTGLSWRVPRPGGGKPEWRVRRDIDPRLRVRLEPLQKQRLSLCLRHGQEAVDVAHRRFQYVKEWESLRKVSPRANTRSLAESIVAQAKRIEGPDFSISVRTLQVWCKNYEAHGMLGLIDGRSTPVGDGGDSSKRTPDAVDYFYSIFHSQGKHSARTCHEATVREAAKQGWNWPASYQATTKWLRKHDERDVTCAHREGQHAYGSKYLPHLEIDWGSFEPGFWYVCDHTPADFWVFDGKDWFRPFLTAVMDYRSRCVVGWNIGKSANQDAIIAALRMAFGEWAIPSRIRVDRGKDFTSWLLTGVTKHQRSEYRKTLGRNWQDELRKNGTRTFNGILGELGIEIVQAIPYHAWSKGVVERWFRTFEEHVAKQFSTYTGNRPENKPDCADEMRGPADMVTLEDARTRMAEFIEIYHHKKHSSLKDEPLRVWQSAATLRKASATELAALMKSRGVYTVGKNGVALVIQGKACSYGANSIALRRHIGRGVWITLDPADVSYVLAYEATSRRFIARCESNQRMDAGTTLEEYREAMNRLAKRRKLMNRAEREAPKRMRNAAAEVAALHREQLAEARKTGTYDRAVRENVTAVRTGFEGVSIPDRKPPSRVDFGKMMNALYPNSGIQTASEAVAEPDQDGSLSDLFHDEPAELPEREPCDLSDLFADPPDSAADERPYYEQLADL